MDERARQDFTEFVAGRSAELLRLADVLTADQHAAEDLLQSALAKAAARWGRIHGAPEGYVRQIMYREQVSWWRRRARRPVTVAARVPDRPAPDPMVMVEARLALREALLALPPGKRAMLVLRYLEDLPEAQVADMLGCSVGTVRSQTHKAIAQLRLVLPSLGLTSTEAGRCRGLRAGCGADRARRRPGAAPGPGQGRRAELPPGAALPALRR